MDIREVLFSGPDADKDPIGWFRDMQKRVNKLNRKVEGFKR